MSDEEIANIHTLFTDHIHEMEEVIQHSAHILSNMTSYISIVLGPEMFEAKLHNIQIIPLTKSTAIFILVTDTGYVENQTIEVPEAIEPADLERTVNILNECLRGAPLYQLRTMLKREVINVIRQHVRNYEQVLEVLQTSFKSEKAEKVFYSGKTNLLNQLNSRMLIRSECF